MWAEVEQDCPETANTVGSVHVTVLKEESIRALSPRVGGVYVDATFGGGGHAEALLEAAPDTVVIAVDRDRSALHRGALRLSRFGDRVRLAAGRFGELPSLVRSVGIQSVDGIVADLGLSSLQLDDASRGMSFRLDGPLDMRMDQSLGETALDLISRLQQDELADVIYRFGEERRSRRVARCIKQAFEDGRLETTLDLRRAIVRAVGPARVGGVDPATRTFQALRIAVNGELEELTSLVQDGAPALLVPGGVLAVISFHSLEDRLVKQAFRDNSRWTPLFKRPLCAGNDEASANPRARSAKLRAARFLGNDLACPSSEDGTS